MKLDFQTENIILYYILYYYYLYECVGYFFGIEKYYAWGIKTEN